MQISVNAASLISLLGMVQGLFLSFVLLRIKKGHPLTNRYLSLLMAALALSISFGFLYETGLFRQWPHIIGIPIAFRLLFGPAIFLYVSHCIDPRRSFRRIDLLHFLPFFMYFVIKLPFLTQTAEQKAAWLGTHSPLVQYSPFYTVLEFFTTIQALSYFAVSYHRVRTFHSEFMNTQSDGHNLHFRWIILGLKLIIGYFIIGILGFTFVMLLLKSAPFVLFKWVAITVSMVLFLAGYFGILYPDYFLSVPFRSVKAKKYEKSPLSQKEIEQLFRQISELMENQRPYLNPGLSLGDLSELIKIPAHHVSQILSEAGGVNFFTFVNGYRIQEARRRLSDLRYHEENLLDILYDCGFNSKSTFNATFKRLTHQTPTQFRKEQHNKIKPS